MKHVKKIHNLVGHLIVVLTASGVWTTPIWRRTPNLDDPRYLRWSFQHKTWYKHYLPKSEVVDIAKLPSSYRLSLAKYEWMFVSPYSWVKTSTHKYLDMPKL